MLHPRYEFPLAYYDIAVIEMDTPVVFSKFVHPICIPVIKEVHESQKMYFQSMIKPFRNLFLFQLFMIVQTFPMVSNAKNQQNSGTWQNINQQFAWVAKIERLLVDLGITWTPCILTFFNDIRFLGGGVTKIGDYRI